MSAFECDLPSDPFFAEDTSLKQSSSGEELCNNLEENHFDPKVDDLRTDGLPYFSSGVHNKTGREFAILDENYYSQTVDRAEKNSTVIIVPPLERGEFFGDHVELRRDLRHRGRGAE